MKNKRWDELVLIVNAIIKTKQIYKLVGNGPSTLALKTTFYTSAIFYILKTISPSLINDI